MDSQQTTEEIDRVIAKAQKILARTARPDGGTRGATEAEADTALAIVQELLLKHNLTMADVEARSASPDAPAERIKEDIEGLSKHKWQRDLAKAVCEANFCYYLQRTEHYRTDGRVDDNGREYNSVRRKRIKHVFVGRKSNVITAQMMFAYLVDAVREATPDAKQDSRFFLGQVLRRSFSDTDYAVRVVASTATLGALAFERIDGEQPHHRGEVYKSLSTAATEITGYPTSGPNFFGIVKQSAEESFREGCADRLCERLSARRRDLIEKHDARVRAEQEAQAKARAEYARKQAGAEARKLPANEGAEARAEMDSLRSTARTARTVPTGDEAIRPDESEQDADWQPGADSEAVEMPAPEAPTSALVLASVYDESEREANEELAGGYKPGTFARWRREQAEDDAKREAELKKRQAEVGTEDNDTTWTPGATTKPETEAQLARREARQAKEYAAARARWAREDAAAERKAEREYARKDHDAYRAGQRKGSDIGLDAQVGKGRDTKRLGS
jgi:hypothetical protein